MDRKKLVKRVALLVIFIFFLNLLAMKFYWYSLLWWFDIPMHYLGGVWLGLAAVYFFPPKEGSMRSVATIISIALFFILVWELYEFIVDENISKNTFDIMDTLSDICFGLGGAFTSVFYYFKRIATPLETSYNSLNG